MTYKATHSLMPVPCPSSSQNLYPGPLAFLHLKHIDLFPPKCSALVIFLPETIPPFPHPQLSHKSPSYYSYPSTNSIFSKRPFLTTQMEFGSCRSHFQFYYLFIHLLSCHLIYSYLSVRDLVLFLYCFVLFLSPSIRL